jgi:hypothetical protein
MQKEIEKKAKKLRRALRRGRLVFDPDFSRVQRVYLCSFVEDSGQVKPAWAYDATSLEGLELQGFKLVDSQFFVVVREKIDMP